jgi:CheY-like chemotaxis protein
MVVEDDLGVREALVMLLDDLGWEVVEAGNGAVALDLLQRDPLPDLVLLDLMMPVLDGWAFLAARREQARLQSIPVVVLTAGGMRHGVDDAEVVGWLQKPFDVGTLLVTMDRALTPT